ncbi:MAG: 5-formyltetrahydrofolate cyclo-ligase [Flavobacteriaceae bacterium]|jgi:5-formyltetrahydrofolate cyclo-ligase|nr:5-formyltetrahydrofolate cyclo-ligase [Flavobacteriaceae bacterium]
MDKKSLRALYKEKREALSLEQIDDLSLDIANSSLQLPIWDKSNYHLFLSIESKKEVDTSYIMQILSGKDKNIIVSRTDFETNSMRHFLMTDNTTFKVSSYGIPEPVDGFEVQPTQIDVVFVPLLAFDTKGNRIGYGKGFYDRFLQECKPDVVKIGISFFEAEREDINDVFEQDIPLDYCITPTQVYTF